MGDGRWVFRRERLPAAIDSTRNPATSNQKPETDIMTMAIATGLDGAIINPLDGRMMANIVAAEALAGRDSFCMNDLKAFRAGVFEA
jgi:hypothetical protein